MGMSPTQRTLRELKNQGRVCAITEKWIAIPDHPGGGVRRDLFGIVDVIALDPVRGFIGVQACAGSGFSAHWEKLTQEKAQESLDWLQTPGGVLELWGWRKLKVKRGGKAMVWRPRIREVKVEDII